MIEKTNFRATKEREEVLPAAAAALHCLYADNSSLIGGSFPWHWHTAFEIDYIERCDVQYQFAGASVTVPQGSAVFINSGELHAFQPCASAPCKIIAFLFDPVFLASGCSDPIYTQYIAPVLHADLPFLLLSSENAHHRQMLASIEKMIRTAREEPRCYELLLRTALGEFWCGLMDGLHTAGELPGPKQKDKERLKRMLDFIHANYRQPLSLKDIAAAAFIGSRECSRCFDRSIGLPPMDYLNRYRIQMAIQQLMTSDKSVTEISECCGFSSVSYFGKVFKRATGLPPLQYRASVSRVQDSAAQRLP